MNIHQRAFTYECEMLLHSSKMSYTLKIIHVFIYHILIIFFPFPQFSPEASSPHPSDFMFSLSKKQRAKQRKSKQTEREREKM